MNNPNNFKFAPPIYDSAQHMIRDTHRQFLKEFACVSPKQFESLKAPLALRESVFNNPNVIRFFKTWLQLSQIKKNQIRFNFNCPAPSFRAAPALTLAEITDFKKQLMALKPWRKGPFDFFGIDIDTEWRSDMKWSRVAPHLPKLKNKVVLDIGCGNGYYMFRMLEHQPKLVVGIDPMDLYYFQFHTLKHFSTLALPQLRHILHYLPLGLMDMASLSGIFDVVFCMGVLYHNRNPLDVLTLIKKVLKKKGGVAIIETLIIESKEPVSLCPYPTYAQMPNVHFIPSVPCLEVWLKRAGFKSIKLVNSSQTTIEEQRGTSWSTPVSLALGLNPQNSLKTIEDYPAPRRAIIIAKL